MIATVRLRNSIAVVCVVGSALTLTGCEYRLYGFVPPSQELVQIAAKAPEQYALQVQTGSFSREYKVPHDGHVTIAIPSYRFPCGVYLFNAVKVGGYSDPLKTWSVSVTRNGTTVHKLSVRAVLKLPVGQDGYRTLRLKD